MIVVNIDKAKAIAMQHAQQVKDKAQRAQFAQAIGEAQDVQALGAVLDSIKTSVENTGEIASGGDSSGTA